VGYRWGEHVGELELRVDAPDEHGVFAAATAALGELLGGDEPRDAGEWFDVAAEGADPAGRVGGYRADPPHLVKAVTYHRLAFAPAAAGGYEATVVLDV
jgi:hypothetical protein